MAWEDIEWTGESYNCTAKLTLKSSRGWSGDVVHYGYNVDISQRRFYFKLDGSVTGTPWGTFRTYTDGNCRTGVTDYNDAIVGISLEHMGLVINEHSGDPTNYIQFAGLGYPPPDYYTTWFPAFGAMPSDTELRLRSNCFSCDLMTVVNEQGGETDYNDVNFDNVTFLTQDALNYIPCTKNGYHYEVEIDTDLPIFETDAHLLEYCRSGGTVTLHILNKTVEPDPEEEYDKQFDFYFIKNKWAHNTRNSGTNAATAKNYRFKPKTRGICFVKHTPTSEEPYDRVLVHYGDYDAYIAAWGEDDDDHFAPYSGQIETHFIARSFSFGSNDYYTKFDFETNIPMWNTQQDADDYFNGLKDISEADNFAYLLRQDASIVGPDLEGTIADTETDLGENGMSFTYGSRLYAITNIELASLFTEVFQPANVQSILDGVKLFGSNTMEAISGVMYLPLSDLSDICELGSLANIKIASWESQQAQGKRILNNKGTINCGSFFYHPTYEDFRDYEPYNLLFFNGPFVGMHQLTISKYIGKQVDVHYNIDVATGAIVCSLLSDGILIDVFDGTCGASRPFSATDNNAYINNIIGSITGASSSASGSIEGITNSVGAVSKAATTGGALATGGAALGAVGLAGGIGAAGIYTGYEVKSAVDNPPQMHRGSLAGNLAYSLNVSPTFLCFSKKVFRPENELTTIGYPSGHGGSVGSFSGFLAVKDLKLANGFMGSEYERAKLIEIVKNGIYI